MKTSKRHFFRTLRQVFSNLGLLSIGITLGVLLLGFLLAGDIYDYEDTVDSTHLTAVDAIVCLGGGRGRIGAAADLWYHYWEQAQNGDLPPLKVPVLYFAGMGHSANWVQLSKQVRKSVAQKITSSDVVIERESSNTDANARWLMSYAKEQRWKGILLLTSGYHMKRAHFIFDELLKHLPAPIDIETYSVIQEPFVAQQWRGDVNGIRVTMFEYFKWIYYRTFWRSNG